MPTTFRLWVISVSYRQFLRPAGEAHVVVLARVLLTPLEIRFALVLATVIRDV